MPELNLSHPSEVPVEELQRPRDSIESLNQIDLTTQNQITYLFEPATLKTPELNPQQKLKQEIDFLTSKVEQLEVPPNESLKELASAALEQIIRQYESCGVKIENPQRFLPKFVSHASALKLATSSEIEKGLLPLLESPIVVVSENQKLTRELAYDIAYQISMATRKKLVHVRSADGSVEVASATSPVPDVLNRVVAIEQANAFVSRFNTVDTVASTTKLIARSARSALARFSPKELYNATKHLVSRKLSFTEYTTALKQMFKSGTEYAPDDVCLDIYSALRDTSATPQDREKFDVLLMRARAGDTNSLAELRSLVSSNWKWSDKEIPKRIFDSDSLTAQELVKLSVVANQEFFSKYKPNLLKERGLELVAQGLITQEKLDTYLTELNKVQQISDPKLKAKRYKELAIKYAAVTALIVVAQFGTVHTAHGQEGSVADLRPVGVVSIAPESLGKGLTGDEILRTALAESKIEKLQSEFAVSQEAQPVKLKTYEDLGLSQASSPSGTAKIENLTIVNGKISIPISEFAKNLPDSLLPSIDVNNPSPEALTAFYESVDYNSPAFIARDGLTFCNIYVATLEGRLQIKTGDRWNKANTLNDLFNNSEGFDVVLENGEVAHQKYIKLNKQQAQELADLGLIVIGSVKNNSGLSGHIMFVAPGVSKDGNMRGYNVGRENFGPEYVKDNGEVGYPFEWYDPNLHPEYGEFQFFINASDVVSPQAQKILAQNN